MSTERQSDLDEYTYNREQTGRGTPIAERAQRPHCRYEDTKHGDPCRLPVAPGQERCVIHLEDDESEHDHGSLLSVAKASVDDVGATEETRCPNGHRIPAMYRPVCPECGAHQGGD